MGFKAESFLQHNRGESWWKLFVQSKDKDWQIITFINNVWMGVGLVQPLYSMIVRPLHGSARDAYS